MLPTTSRSSKETYHSYALATLGLLALIILLKIAEDILAPIGISILLIALIYPVKNFFARYVSNFLSYLGAFITLILILTFFISGLYLSFLEVAEVVPKYKTDVIDFVRHLKYRLSMNGVDAYEKIKLKELKNIVIFAATDFRSVLISFALVNIYVMLALPEIANWKQKIYHCLPNDKAERIVRTFEQIGNSFQTYLKATLICCTLNAVVTYSISIFLGLELAFTWAVLAFLLNFIPVVGAICTIIPPIILSFLQFDDLTMPLMTTATFCISHLIMGNIIEPKVQGKMLSLSPILILISLSFWSALWGIAGALLSAPLMHGLIMICQYSNSMRWVSCLLTQKSDEKY